MPPCSRKKMVCWITTSPSCALANRVRAFNPWPGAFLLLAGPAPQSSPCARPVPRSRRPTRRRTVIDGLPAVGAVGGWLVLEEVQPAGKRSMLGKDFLAWRSPVAENWKPIHVQWQNPTLPPCVFSVSAPAPLAPILAAAWPWLVTRVVFLERPEPAEKLRMSGLTLHLGGEAQRIETPQIATNLDEALTAGSV